MIHFDSDETIVSEVRKHWFVIFSQGAAFFFLALLPVLALFFASSVNGFEAKIADFENAVAVIMFLYSLWLLMLWSAFFFKWTDFYLDVWYVTNKRVIDVEQKGIFRRDISTLYYENIRDITTRTHGIIRTMLNFGDIHMQTSGEYREFIIRNAADPDVAKEAILKEYRRVTEKIQTVRLEPKEQSTGNPLP